jgi:hypothetical protein
VGLVGTYQQGLQYIRQQQQQQQDQVEAEDEQTAAAVLDKANGMSDMLMRDPSGSGFSSQASGATDVLIRGTSSVSSAILTCSSRANNGIATTVSDMSTRVASMSVSMCGSRDLGDCAVLPAVAVFEVQEAALGDHSLFAGRSASAGHRQWQQHGT